tara:strand:- start:855 stop:1079 length:225 start_codon:yes stop_codon:yes gene_type:complete
MKKKKITQEEVAAATEKFLKNGGKIKMLDLDATGADFKQRVNQAEIRVYGNRSRYRAIEVDPVPYSNKFGWGSH